MFRKPLGVHFNMADDKKSSQKKEQPKPPKSSETTKLKHKQTVTDANSFGKGRR